MIFRFLSVTALIAVSAGPVAAADPGQAIYQRCAACHLSSRAGVPGSFPALNQEPAKLAQSAQGRRYMILGVSRGLAGPINSDGKAFRGTMPAQALTDAQIADVLNYLVNSAMPVGKKPAAFTAAEVNTVRAAAGNLTATQVAQQRPK